MGRKLTSNERIGLLLTGILIILACIALAVIPRRGAQPVSEIPQIIQTPDTLPAPRPDENTSAPTKPIERNHLNEDF